MSYTDNMDKGETLSKILRAHSVNFSQLAKEIDYYKKGKGVSRNALYDWMNDPKLSSDKIIAITRAIPHLPTRHSGLVSEIEAAFTDLRIGEIAAEEQEKYSKVTDIDCRKQIDFWRNKYIKVLEDMNAIQERCNALQQEVLNLRLG